MFVLSLGDFADGQVLVLLKARVLALKDENVSIIIGDQSDVSLVAQRRPPLRIGQLHEPILNWASSGFVPRRHVVVQVPILESKRKADLQCGTLTQNADTAPDAAFEPFEL